MSRRQRIVASSPCWEALTIHDGPMNMGILRYQVVFYWRNTPCPWWQPMWHQNKRSNTLLLKHGFLLEGWFLRSYTQEDLSIDPLIRLKTTTRRINHTKSNTFHQGFVWVVIHVLLHQWLYIYIYIYTIIYIYIYIYIIVYPHFRMVKPC